MGFETRKGKTYYYRKRRVGARVLSEYSGKSEIALLIAQYESSHRAEQEQRRERERIERAAFQKAEKRINQLAQMSKNVMRAALLAQGYHTHKGQWRKRRE